MHEMGIAQKIVDTVAAEAERRPGERIVTVGLKLGELAGVEADSLRFAFETLTKGTELESVALVIEPAPRRHCCTQCWTEFDIVDDSLTCPGCGEGRTRLISGNEIEVVYLETEEK